MALTLYRLAEEIKGMLDGGYSPVASGISFNEIKIAVGQVCNKLLKIDHYQINEKIGETIPNGTVIALYEDILVTKWRGKAVATLPIKPLKLKRNMGIFSVFLSDNPDIEFVLIQMGQSNMIRGQKLLSELSGRTGVENFGDKLVFQKDITDPPNEVRVSMRLAIMDVSLYGDHDLLPILPEMEWDIKTEVFKLYSEQPIPDRIVDSTTSDQKGNQIKTQSQN